MRTFLLLLLSTTALAQAPVDLTGLWKARRNAAPFASARLLVIKDADGYRADILGRSVPIARENGELAFTLPNDAGSFRGKLEKNGTILGHWLRSGGTATPVVLRPASPATWSGTVTAAADELTFFLLLRPDGANSWTAVLRNPERDFGSILGVSKLVRDGKELKLVDGKGTAVGAGSYDAESEAMILTVDGRGSFDFVRESDTSDFYPRGAKPAQYVYHPPPALDDGWATSTLASAGIDVPQMERLIQRLIETPMDSNDAPQYNAVLVARNGKLVLEEYFHGDTREKTINTRSAAKSVTSILVGAAMHAGAPLSISSPVYKVMNGGAFPTGLEPQKRAMTLEHLLTQSSGYYCDDTDEKAPGNEDHVWDTAEEHPDFARYTLTLPMATPPGEKSVYCSVQPNLALAMVGAAMKESPLYAFDRLVAQPMKIRHYVWGRDRAGNPYGGGGAAFTARDFLKFGQLILDGGAWNGRQIVSREFARASITPQYHLRRVTYGYLWWMEDLPYKGRTVRAFMALGNGGNNIVAVPELGLVVALMSTNYASRTTGKIREIVPRSILPAVRRPGDDPHAPVADQEYTNPYGRSEDGSRIAPK